MLYRPSSRLLEVGSRRISTKDRGANGYARSDSAKKKAPCEHCLKPSEMDGWTCRTISNRPEAWNRLLAIREVYNDLQKRQQLG